MTPYQFFTSPAKVRLPYYKKAAQEVMKIHNETITTFRRQKQQSKASLRASQEEVGGSSKLTY